MRNDYHRPGPGRAGARAPRCRLLPGTSHDRRPGEPPARTLRRRLEGALDTGLVTTSSTPATVRSVLGLRDGAEDLLADLNTLERTGVTGRAAAAWLRAVEQARARSPTPDLVWSGPEVAGLHARDTRRVYEELLGSAEALDMGEHVRLLRRTAGIRRPGGPDGRDTGAAGDAAVEHPAKTRRHHRRGSARATVRRSILDDGLARQSAPPRLLRSPISRYQRPCGGAPRQGGDRGR